MTDQQLQPADTERHGITKYARTLVTAAPGKTALTLTLMIAVSATEWVGLVMLVPLLAIAGLDVGEGMVEQISQRTAAAMEGLGLTPSVLTVLVIYMVVVTLRALLGRWLSLSTVDLERSFLVHLRKRLYRAIIYSRWIFFARSRASDFVHATIGQCATVSLATNLLLRIIGSTLVGLVYLGLAIQLSPLMSLIAVSSGLGLLFILRKSVARARYHGGQMTESSKRLLGAMTEHLNGMKAVKSYGAEERNERMFGELTEQAAHAYIQSSRNGAFTRLWFEIGSTGVLCALLYLAIVVIPHSTAEILLLLYLFARLVPRFSAIQQMYQSFLTMMPAFGNVMSLTEQCLREAEPRRTWPSRSVELRDEVRLDGVTFSYRADGGERTLHDVSLFIPARKTTAIVGPSGGGKSTIADVLLGLLAPDAGHVLVDGAPVDSEVQSWREQIGYVPQDTFLFHDTIRENLLWACPDASEEELWAALRLASAESFVSQLPQGLETVIGDRGVLLSGGERQRIALARALLRRPSLLILDEATSALDSENERRIQQAIEELQGRTTIVVITHRLSTIRRADIIHVVDEGTVVESGSWQELLARDGRFAALCAAQGLEEDVNQLGYSSPRPSAAVAG